MPSRLDRIQKLTEGLAALPEPANLAPRRGRPPVDTVPFNLRLPTRLRDRATVEAGRRSQAQRRNVTAQSVILEILERHLPRLPEEQEGGLG